MLSNVPNTMDKSQNSFIHDVIAPAALEFVNLYMELEYVRGQFDVDNLVSEDLDKFVSQRTGIERRKATYATTTVVITGEEGAVVQQGDLVSNGEINYVIQENKTISASRSVEVKVKASVPGSVGNTSVETITTFPRNLIGLIDVYNTSAATNGYDEESDEELRERYYRRLEKPGKAGNKYHYEEWAREVNGVGGVKVFPTWNGPLTVKVIIIDSNQKPADEELISLTKEHILNEAPFGAEVTIEGAKTKEVNVQATLTIEEGYEEADVIENVSANIEKYLGDIAFQETFVSYAIIGSLLIDSEGVSDYQNLKLNNGTKNITVGNEEIAILGGVINE